TPSAAFSVLISTVLKSGAAGAGWAGVGCAGGVAGGAWATSERSSWALAALTRAGGTVPARIHRERGMGGRPRWGDQRPPRRRPAFGAGAQNRRASRGRPPPAVKRRARRADNPPHVRSPASLVVARAGRPARALHRPGRRGLRVPPPRPAGRGRRAARQ